MIRVTTGAALADRVDRLRTSGDRVAFVPTMGALHEGHLALVDRAREVADRVVVSIFVNPKQFDDTGDLAAYPRPIEEDAELLERSLCDVLFLPTVEEMYPTGFASAIDVAGPALGLEGLHREGHFQGVATVVAKLLLLVRPDCAIFGEKDAQQLAVVRRMVEDLHLGVEVLSVPTVREADGLALSSRNRRLPPEDRRAALVIYRALRQAVERIAEGERSADRIRLLMRETIANESRARLEYAEVVDAETFAPVDEIRGEMVLPIAAFIGSIRLIDNLCVYTMDTDEISLAELALDAESADSNVPEN